MNIAIKKKPITIIFESGYSGHRSMYIAHLMRYINSNPDQHNKFLFVLNTGMQELLNDLAHSENYYCRFIPFRKNYYNYVTRSFKEWKLVGRLIEEHGNVSTIIFMDIDPYLILITTTRFRKFKLKTRGILFQPYLHFKELRGVASFFKKVFKNYILQKFALLMNSHIDKFFILNDKPGVAILNRRLKKVFYNIPDPIENNILHINKTIEESFLKKYNITAAQKNLLVFGSIDSRKNLISIIDAILLLPARMKKEIHLVISGKISSESKERYLSHIEKYKNEISIAYNDDFVKDVEREVVFRHCDLVMMPYVNFYSASSVVGHAICYNKNIIAPNKGLLAKIVRTNKLGINVDPHNVNEIKNAIVQILYNGVTFKYDGVALIEEYNPINFSKSILTD